ALKMGGICMQICRSTRQIGRRSSPESAHKTSAFVRSSYEGASSRVPDDARVCRAASKIEGGVRHALPVVRGPPPEKELGFRIVEPGRMVRGANGDGRKAARCGEVRAELAVVDRLVHA